MVDRLEDAGDIRKLYDHEPEHRLEDAGEYTRKLYDHELGNRSRKEFFSFEEQEV